MLSAASPSWLSNVSQVEVLITRACNPTMGEPNYALHLEVAEYINQKKANTCVAYHLILLESRDSNCQCALRTARAKQR